MNHSIRVLHLEDNPRDAELVQQKLKTEGLSFEIVWVDRKEAFDSALEREAFDLVLTDYNLPDYDGISALKRVREKRPDLPVIVVSGTLGEEEAVECLKAGATDYVLKQRLQRLGAAVRAVLDRNRLERAARAAEKGLRESEERFRQLAENIRDVFFLTSAGNTQILYVSPAYEAIWGRTCESLCAQPQSWIDAIHPEDREHALRNFQEGTKSGRFDYQYRIVRPDGEMRWIRTRGYPIKDPSGTLIRIAGIAVDISERKRNEEALKDSEYRLDLALEASELAVWEWNLATKDVRFSRHWWPILGYKPDEIPLRIEAWENLTHPVDLVRVRSMLAACVKGLVPVLDVEYRMRAKNGEWRWIRSVGRVVERDAAGRVLRMTGTHGDITERKLAEEKLRRLNRVYAVLSGINTLIVRVRDRQELFNEACCIAVEHGNFGMAWIGTFDPATQDVTAVAWAGIDAERVAKSKSSVRAGTPQREGVTGRAVRQKKPVFDNDITAEPDVGSARRQEVIRRGYRSAIALPLLVEGEAIGALTLYTKEQEFFNGDELRLLTELAGDISFALEHIAGQQKLDKLTRVRAVSSEINAAIVHVRSRKELFDEGCRIAVEYGNFGIAWIGLYDPRAETVTPVAWGGKDAPEYIGNFVAIARHDQSSSRGELFRAIRGKTPIFSNDISADPDAGGTRRQEAVRRGYRSHIVLPLMTEGQVAATLALFAKEADFFTADEIKVLEEMASDVSFALQSIARQEKIEKLSRTRAVSSGINAALVRVRNRQELFRESCRIAVEHGQFPFAWIGVLDPATQDVTPVAWAGEGAKELTRGKSSARDDIPGGKGAVGQAIRERRPVFNNDIAAHSFGGPRLKEILRLGFRSQITLPLFEDQTVIGTLTIYASEPNFFDDEELKLLTELAGDISFALENISRQHKLDKLSRIRAVLGEINAAQIRIRDRDALLRETCRIATEHGGFELVWVAWLDHEKQEVRPIAWTGFSPEAVHAVTWATVSASQGPLAEAMRTRRPAISPDIGRDARIGNLRREALSKGHRSCVTLPVMVDDTVVAAINLYGSGQGFFDQDEIALFSEIAGDLSFALQSITHQEKVEYLSYYDVLTGLANPVLFHERLTQYLSAAEHAHGRLALALINLQRFKNVNDSLGRQTGDELLKQIAGRLTRCAGDVKEVARLGADNFTLVLPGVQQDGDVARIIEQRLRICFGEPFMAGGTELRISAQIGIALFPNDGADAGILLRNAEAALKKAKASGERYLFYQGQMNAMAAHTLQLESRLRQAVESKQFVLHYQVKIDLASGRISGLEALIRWNDPQTGLVPPMQFIPLLEETGMILEVGRWAIHKALEDHREWSAQGLQAPRIAVNVSPIQLRQKDFVDEVRNEIGAFTGGPLGLDLEITESLIMEDMEGNIAKLRAIKDLGINIAIDDFGTGYSSLGYLAMLPVNALKIDRSFIVNMVSSADSMTIVSTIISLAHSLGLKVIAEGVETEEQSKILKLLKCDEGQGYLFSKPLPADEVEAFLKTNK
jgi:diguanylate cyclase (GGDEF)-like protein/PAS domain S-box-containing protein